MLLLLLRNPGALLPEVHTWTALWHGQQHLRLMAQAEIHKTSQQVMAATRKQIWWFPSILVACRVCDSFYTGLPQMSVCTCAGNHYTRCCCCCVVSAADFAQLFAQLLPTAAALQNSIQQQAQTAAQAQQQQGSYLGAAYIQGWFSWFSGSGATKQQPFLSLNGNSSQGASDADRGGVPAGAVSGSPALEHKHGYANFAGLEGLLASAESSSQLAVSGNGDQCTRSSTADPFAMLSSLLQLQQQDSAKQQRIVQLQREVEALGDK